jgi:tRNA-uridine 2-sulfurtransferase
VKAVAAIALSGGVDSLVAAHLLKKEGFSLLGLHFLTGFEPWVPLSLPSTTASAPLDMAKARLAPLAAQLDLPIEVVDLRAAFHRKVIDYFTTGYAQARTPNPCLVCNPGIKFGDLLARARQRGADFLATGHYARIIRDSEGTPCLLKGVDPAKDQSYFLARLTAAQLARANFPLGELTKAHTRTIARREGLRPLGHQESQDICFIRDGAYRDFLTRQPGFLTTPGPVVNTQGRQLGTHQGLHRYTIGQRRGIGIPGPDPYYVVRLEPQTNRLVVGVKDALYRRSCRVEEINWIGSPPREPQTVAVRIRYRHRAAEARLIPRSDHCADIVFTEPQKAVTPGQGAVFYNDEQVLGGGWITTEVASGGDFE